MIIPGRQTAHIFERFFSIYRAFLCDLIDSNLMLYIQHENQLTLHTNKV
jgi:hypothetical protein